MRVHTVNDLLSCNKMHLY